MKKIYMTKLVVIFCLSGLILNSYGQKRSPFSSLASRPGNQPSLTPSPAKSNKKTGGITPLAVVSAAPGIIDYNDVQIFPSTAVQAEVHISVNRQSPNILLASANTYANNNYNQGRYVSTNGGSTWTGSDVLNTNNPSLGGDPSTAIDASGRMYISTITPTGNGYFLTTSSDNGTTFSNLTQGVTAGAFDKEMIAAENTAGLSSTNFLYSAWTDFGTGTVVNFNRSINQGVSFSQPITLKNGPGQGTNVQTGPNGEVYVCYADYGATTFTLPARGLGFVRSLDGGVTFSAASVPVSYVGIRKSNSGDASFNNIRVNDFPAMAVDKSGFSRNGRIYAVFAAQQNGNGKAVIQITSSDNRGDNWTAPREISIAVGIQSFMPWVCVDQNTGAVYVAYYSIDGSNFQTNTYLAISNDGGNTFINQKVSDVPHTTQPINNTIFANGYAGDYIGVTAAKGSAFVAWADNRNGAWQVYVSRVDNIPVITGNTAFCTTSQFTVSNIDPAATVSWSTSAGGVISVPSTGNPVTATKVSQGNVTLTATVYGFLTASVNITTTPKISSIDYSMNGPCNGSIQTWSLNANPNMTATSWNWTVDNPSSGIYIYNPNSPSTFADVSGGGGVSVTFVNTCGETSLRDGVTIYSNCPRFAVSPNPAVSQVAITPIVNTKNVSSSSSVISGVNIYDLQGNLYKHLLFNGVKSASINVSSLTSGTYIVEIISQTNGAINKEKQLLNIIR